MKISFIYFFYYISIINLFINTFLQNHHQLKSHMKSSSLFYLFSYALVIILTLLYACRKDGSSQRERNDNIDIESAKTYYRTLKAKEGNIEISRGSSATSIRPNKKFVMFSRAYVGENQKYSFVEAPLFYTRKPSSLIGTKTPDIANNQLENSSMDRLVIYKSKLTGKIDQKIITYIPDASYLKKHGNDASINYINRLTKDFSGHIVYKNWAGKSLNILKIVNGKATRRHSYNRKNLENTYLTKDKSNNSAMKDLSGQHKLMTNNCVGVYQYDWERDCTYTDPEHPENAVCTEWVLVGTTYLYDICTEGEDEYRCLDPDNFEPECIGEDYSPIDTTKVEKNPCNEKSIIASIMTNTGVTARLNQVITKYNSPYEWGIANNITSPFDISTGSNAVYHPTTLVTQNSSTTVNIPFSWNINTGFTISTIHRHPNGGAPSPDDIFKLLANLADSGFTSYPASIPIYKKYVTSTIVTDSDVWVVSVKDWTILGAQFSTFVEDTAAYHTKYSQLVAWYKDEHPTASNSDATTFALLGLLKPAINLYKRDYYGTAYIPIEAGLVGASNTPMIRNIPCP